MDTNSQVENGHSGQPPHPMAHFGLPELPAIPDELAQDALDLMAMFEEQEAANQEQPGAGEEGTFTTPPVNPILPLPRAPKRPKVTKPAGERCEKGKKEPVRRKLVFNTPHKIKSVCFIGCPTRRQSKGNFYQRLEIVEELADGTEKEIITSVDRIPEYLAVLRTENYEVYCKFISNLF